MLQFCSGGLPEGCDFARAFVAHKPSTYCQALSQDSDVGLEPMTSAKTAMVAADAWDGLAGKVKVLKMPKAKHLPRPARASISFNNLQLRERNDLLLLQCSLARRFG